MRYGKVSAACQVVFRQWCMCACLGVVGGSVPA